MYYSENKINVKFLEQNKKSLNINDVSEVDKYDNILKIVEFAEITKLNDKELKELAKEVKYFAKKFLENDNLKGMFEEFEEKYGVNIKKSELKKYEKYKKNIKETKTKKKQKYNAGEIPIIEAKEIRNKIMSEIFWYRKLKTLRKFKVEEVEQRLKNVGVNRSQYCSLRSIKMFESRKEKNKEFLENSYIKNNGVVLSLAQCTRTEYHRYSEFYTYMQNIELYAEELGFNWCFITLTLQPEWHINPSQGENKWNGKGAKEGNNELTKQWHNIQRRLYNNEIRHFGVRVAEPHMDGTAHAHIMLFYDDTESSFDKIKETVKKYFPIKKISKKGELVEQGKVEKNNGKAKASSYISKYIAKGFEENSVNNNLNVKAWRNTFNIRAFQFFGLKRIITKIRLLRKIDSEIDLVKRAKENDFKFLIKFFNEYDTEEVVKCIKENVVNVYGGISQKITGLEINKEKFITAKNWEKATLDEYEAYEERKDGQLDIVIQAGELKIPLEDREKAINDEVYYQSKYIIT